MHHSETCADLQGKSDKPITASIAKEYNRWHLHTSVMHQLAFTIMLSRIQ